MNRSLVVNTEGCGGQVSVDAGSGASGLAISFSETACRTVDAGENFVDAGRCELRVEACPGGVEEGCGHIFAGGVAEAFVQPQDFTDQCLVEKSVLG
jgi:hypothetical protein